MKEEFEGRGLLFVIGRNRSGTKWLSNIFAENKDISAIQREGAGGIIECNLISNYPKILGFENVENKTAFEILFQHDNFHKCSGLDNSIISSFEYNDNLEFFHKYVNKVTGKRGTLYFLQKAPSNALPVLLEKFPKAKFVIIQRTNVVENVISNLLLGTNKISYIKLTRLLLGYWRYRKIENKYESLFDNVEKVTYEELKKDTEKTVKHICDYLNITYTNDMLDNKYIPNTSYKKGIDKSKFLTQKNKVFVNMVSFFLKRIPLPVMNIFFKIRLIADPRENFFISKTFELYRLDKSNFTS